ncbi:NfeD family protein [Algisphaera agarilytica]|uniref:Membrane-bound serine protease (ClpP class) n=1 Tax=Algisphaera agarilytica TaxID=1385975 RepID=A0A7X0H5P6_9BACT|nr:NfeD family protein [Algisphaera agarilytica]MBB6429709.1 membrane-bound serine protease (ClpP class) [Algisphaera agarilytica]
MKRSFRRAGLLLVLLGLMLGLAEPASEPSPEVDPPVTEAAAESEVVETEASAESNPTAASAPAKTVSSLPSGSNVAVIPIEGIIYDFTLDSLQRRIDRALADGASVIVLEIDTNGGLVTAALDISRYLKDPTEVPVPTVAWIKPKALSAGIMIAAACDEIIMAPAAQTGDCAPIVPGMNLSPTERAKAFSPIAAEFKNSAATNGYTYATFHAMCVLGVELYLIEHPDTGERLVVNQADYAVMVNGDLSASTGIPIDNSTSTPSGNIPSLPIPGSSNSQTLGPTNTTLDLAEAESYRPEDVGVWKPVISLPSGKSAPNGRFHSGVGLLFTTDDVLAADIGLSKATIQNDADLQRYLGAASVTRIDQSWSENFAGFLTKLWVRAILVVLLAIGVFLELQAPGLGIPGAIALLALVGLFGAPMIIGLADIWHILLFMVGLTLLIVEIGLGGATFGVLGVVGIIVMIGALVISVIPSTGGIPAPGMWNQLLAALLATVIAFVLGGVGIGLLMRNFGNIPGLSRLVLADAQASAGDVTEPTHLAGDEVHGNGHITVGQTGKVLSTLRPAGEAEIDGQVIDVTSLGAFLEPGTPIRVVEVTRYSIVVDAVQES